MRQRSLARIRQLLADTPLPWHAVHVGGPRNRRSTCEVIAGNLQYYNDRSKIRNLTRHQPLAWGTFTRHLIDRWDGITINNKTIAKEAFLDLEARIKAFDKKADIGATQAEIMTAIAFKAFTQAKIDVGIIEVADDGGADDPTNILGEESSQVTRAKPLLTLLTSMETTRADQTIAQVAVHHAAILQKGVPVMHYGTRNEELMAVMSEQYITYGTTLVDIKDEVEIEDKDNLGDWYHDEYFLWAHRDAPPEVPIAADAALFVLQRLNRLERPELVRHDVWHRQLVVLKANFALSYLWLPYLDSSGPLYLRPLPGRPVLDTDRLLKLWLSAAETESDLREELEQSFITRYERDAQIVWLIAADAASPIKDVLPAYVRSEDTVIATEFGGVEAWPEVRTMAADALLASIQTGLDNKPFAARACPSLEVALREALELLSHVDAWVVGIGSRHLLASVRKLIRDGVFELAEDEAHPIIADKGFTDDD